MASIIETSRLPDTTQIDPNMFNVQWDVLLEVLVLIIVISFIVERFLAVLFESKYWLKLSHQRGDKGTFKPLIALVVSLIVCMQYQIDVMAVLMSHQHVSLFGEFITAGVIAGGSKASIKLFRDVLKIKSEYKTSDNAEPPKADENKT